MTSQTEDGTRGKSFLGFLGWAALVFAVAFVGSRFTPDTWFAALRKPSWNPPLSVFAPVWTALYALMAVAAWLVWKKAGFSGARAALIVFVVQLALNGLWPYVFFGRHEPGLALLDIAALWLAILVTTNLFTRVSRGSGFLFLPYLVWVTFASALNLAIWRMNR